MKNILAIPGLGGHKSVYKDYAPFFLNCNFNSVELVNLKRDEENIKKLINEGGGQVIIANCYGAIPVMRFMEESEACPEKLVILEPFLAELFWWTQIALPTARMLLFLSRLLNIVGIHRGVYKKDIDYVRLSKYPMWVQPAFDILHQPITLYLEKIVDLLSYKPTKHISVETLLIFSQGGYSQDLKKRQKIVEYFEPATVVELTENTHNIVTVSSLEISRAINKWL